MSDWIKDTIESLRNEILETQPDYPFTEDRSERMFGCVRVGASLYMFNKIFSVKDQAFYQTSNLYWKTSQELVNKMILREKEKRGAFDYLRESFLVRAIKTDDFYEVVFATSCVTERFILTPSGITEFCYILRPEDEVERISKLHVRGTSVIHTEPSIAKEYTRDLLDSVREDCIKTLKLVR